MWCDFYIDSFIRISAYCNPFVVDTIFNLLVSLWCDISCRFCYKGQGIEYQFVLGVKPDVVTNFGVFGIGFTSSLSSSYGCYISSKYHINF